MVKNIIDEGILTSLKYNNQIYSGGTGFIHDQKQ